MIKDEVVKFTKRRKGREGWGQGDADSEETSRVEHGRSKREIRLHHRDGERERVTENHSEQT